MRVRYTLRARPDLEGIYEYLEERTPAAAQSFKATIERQIGWLSDFPYMAPTTDEPGVRELTLTRYPYKIYYEVSDDEVRILHIRHVRRGGGAIGHEPSNFVALTWACRDGTTAVVLGGGDPNEPGDRE